MSLERHVRAAFNACSFVSQPVAGQSHEGTFNNEAPNERKKQVLFKCLRMLQVARGQEQQGAENDAMIEDLKLSLPSFITER